MNENEIIEHFSVNKEDIIFSDLIQNNIKIEYEIKDEEFKQVYMINSDDDNNSTRNITNNDKKSKNNQEEEKKKKIMMLI